MHFPLNFRDISTIKYISGRSDFHFICWPYVMSVQDMGFERALRQRFLEGGLASFIGAKVVVFDKSGLLAVGLLESVDPNHLNLYLRDAWILRDGEPYYTPKLLIKGEVLARMEVAQPGGPYLDHKGKVKVDRTVRRRRARALEY